MEILAYKLDFDNLDERISHLTKVEIVNVIKKYYSGEKVSLILQEFNIKCHVTKLISMFPAVISDSCCPKCNKPFLWHWESRDPKDRFPHLHIDKFICRQCEKTKSGGYRHSSVANKQTHSETTKFVTRKVPVKSCSDNCKCSKCVSSRNLILERNYQNSIKLILGESNKINNKEPLISNGSINNKQNPNKMIDFMKKVDQKHEELMSQLKEKQQEEWARKEERIRAEQLKKRLIYEKNVEENRLLEKRLEMAARIRKENEKKKYDQTIREFLKNYYNPEKWRIRLEKDLTLEERLYLSVILNLALSKNKILIKNIEKYQGRIAPTLQFEEEIMQKLIDSLLVIPHIEENTDTDAFSIIDVDGMITVGLYLLKVPCFALNIAPMDDNYEAMIERLIKPKFHNDPDFREFSYHMWLKIATHECVRHLDEYMKRLDLEYDPQDEHLNIFKNHLKSFSVSQLIRIIYGSVRFGKDQHDSVGYNDEVVTRIIIKTFDTRTTNFQNTNKSVEGYQRLASVPESGIFKELFYNQMEVDELGFIEIPEKLL